MNEYYTVLYYVVSENEVVFVSYPNTYSYTCRHLILLSFACTPSMKVDRLLL